MNNRLFGSLLLSILLSLFGCWESDSSSDANVDTYSGEVNHSEATFVDSRDKQVYPLVRMLDGKIWFAKNVNYSTEGSFCNDCQEYGRLYTWNAAQSACPKGWHLPTMREWWDMLNLYEEKSDFYDHPDKITFTGNRDNPLFMGGESGFNIQLSGWWFNKSKKLKQKGDSGFYWTSTAISSKKGYRIYFSSLGNDIFLTKTKLNIVSLSCRCVKDEN